MRENLIRISEGIIRTLQEEPNWRNNRMLVQQNIINYEKVGMEISVIEKNNNFTIISSTNLRYLNQNAMDILEPELILAAFNGERKEKDILYKQEDRHSSKNMVFPLYDENNRIVGALYLRQNLEDIYSTLNQSQSIFIRATLLALFITVILGYLIAKSITGPINDVTVKAEKMAKGDFDQVVEVKSDDEIGQLAHMFNYLTAHLKSVLQEMSNEKNKMNTIITYMADGLIAATDEGKIIHANPRALEMLHLDKDAIAHKNFDEVFFGLNEALTIKNLKCNKNNWTGSKIIDMKEGVKLRANYAPFMKESGELDGIVILLQDVTENEKLENMRKEFVANVSHELKTPLTTIKSYTETLLDGDVENNPITNQFLQVIHGETDRMARLVRDLLQLSNLDYKKSNWIKKEIDLNSIIEKAILKLEVASKDKNHELSYHSDEDSIIIFGDEDSITQVTLNILSNAIKYTPQGGKISINLSIENATVLLYIQDNGMGIPSQDLPRIFERFYRVDKARSRELGGTGLGLSIAKQIIEAHDGNIQLFSNEEKGTKVMITIPLGKVTDQYNLIKVENV